MKKIILTLTTVMLAYCAISQGISAGLKAGANITNFTGGNFDDAGKKALIGFHAGAFLNIRFGGLSLQPELLISTAGAKFDNADSSFKLTYLSLPVMLKYRTVLGLYFEAGPQFSFKLDENSGDKTINNFAKDLDLSAAVGVGMQSKRGLGIGVRYLAGLSKVGDFEASDAINPDFKNSVLQIGISFPLSK